MKIINRRRGTVFLSLSALLSLVFASFFAPLAYADNGAGVGPRGSTYVGVISGSVYTWEMFSGSPGEAWNKLYTETMNEQMDFPRSVGGSFTNAVNYSASTSTGEPLSSVCQRSSVIWFRTVSRGAGGTRNWESPRGSRWYSNNTFWAYWNKSHIPTSGWGDMGDDVLYRMAQSGIMSTQSKYSIVCSGDITPQWDFEFDVYGTDSGTYNGVYSYTATADGKYIPNGKWNTVTPAVHKTEFGKLYDKMNGSTEENYNALASQAGGLAAASQTPGTDVTVNIGDQNSKTLAKGGVVDYALQAKPAQVAGSAKVKYHVKMSQCQTAQPAFVKAGQTAISKSSRQEAADFAEAAKGLCDKGTVTVSGPEKSFNITRKYTTPKMVGFWETIVAHCNKEGFDSLRQKLADNAVSEGSSKNTGTLSTRQFTDKTEARSVLGGLLGESVGSLSETGGQGFYDKECPFSCSPDPVKTTPSKGTDSIDIDSNGPDVTAFRDNETKAFTVHRWVPNNEDGVEFNSDKKALTTTLTVDRNGTPSVTGKASDGSDAGTAKISAFDSDGKEKDVFGVDPNMSDSSGVQKNWDTSTKGGLYTSVLKGEFTTFGVRANWASDDGKPVKLNIKWEYQPGVVTNISTDKVGFNANGGQTLGNVSGVPGSVQGKCYAAYSRGGAPVSQPDTTKLFHDNTGTGTVNNLDKDVLGDTASQLTVTFVRASTN